MPPKRKAAPTAASTRSKRARIGETHPSGRPVRAAIGKPQYNFTRFRAKTPAHGSTKDKSTSHGTDVPRKRGTPSKTASTPIIVTVPSPATGSDNVADQVKLTTSKTNKLINTKSASKTALASKTSPTGTSEPLKKRRGRPMRVKSQAVQPSPNCAADDSGTDGSVDEEVQDRESQYWLMKAEPNDRFENGVNVKFSIDDLAAASKPEPWDGVRNYAARNNMRVMRKNDLSFFYHSNCAIPGIVGIMRIVHEHSTDQSAFDPKHPYFDPKSTPENPKWEVVHVEFVKKFDTEITLKMINDNAAHHGELADMQLVKQKRLSVTSVRPSEWRYILSIANEALNVGQHAA